MAKEGCNCTELTTSKQEHDKVTRKEEERREKVELSGEEGGWM